MAFVINQNFELKSRRKDFARQELALADLKSTLDADYPDDYIVAIGGEIYIFNSSNSKDETLGKWRKLETGEQLTPSLTALSGLPVLEITAADDGLTAKPFDHSTVNNGAQILIVIHDATDIYHLGYIAQDGYYFFDRDGTSWQKLVVAEDNSVTNSDVPFTVAWADVSGKPTFARVATSGSYADLDDKPTIPAAQVQSDWNATSGVAAIKNKPTIPKIIDVDLTADGAKFPVPLNTAAIYRVKCLRNGILNTSTGDVLVSVKVSSTSIGLVNTDSAGNPLANADAARISKITVNEDGTYSISKSPIDYADVINTPAADTAITNDEIDAICV